MYSYSHLSPVILTDSLWAMYTSECLTSGTYAQRRAAYTTAESLMITHLRSFLLPTTVTGTYVWPATPEALVLPWKNVRSVDRLVVKSLDDSCTCDLSNNTGCALIRNDGMAYIDMRVTNFTATAQCGCGYYSKWLYQAEVTTTSGLSTGTAAGDTRLHQALAMIATEVLIEMVDPGLSQGGPGAPGVKSYGTLGYSETFNEHSIRATALGNSTIANRAAKLVKHLKPMRALRF